MKMVPAKMSLVPIKKNVLYMPREHFPAWGAQNSKFSFYLPPLPLGLDLDQAEQLVPTICPTTVRQLLIINYLHLNLLKELLCTN